MPQKRLVEWRQVFTISEAARRLNRDDSVIGRHIRDGKITFEDGTPAWYKDSAGRVYVYLPAVEQYLRERGYRKPGDPA